MRAQEARRSGPSPERGESHHHGGRMRVGSARVGQGEGKESQVQGHKDVFTNVPELTELEPSSSTPLSLYPLKCSSVLAAVRLTLGSLDQLSEIISKYCLNLSGKLLPPFVIF